MSTSIGRLFFLCPPAILVVLSFHILLHAQQSDTASARVLTTEDYARAEKFLLNNVGPLVYHNVNPVWAGDDRLWYRDTDQDGAKFVLADVLQHTKEPAFDHDRIAAALAKLTGKSYQANKLPFQEIELPPDGQSVLF